MSYKCNINVINNKWMPYAYGVLSNIIHNYIKAYCRPILLYKPPPCELIRAQRRSLALEVISTIADYYDLPSISSLCTWWIQVPSIGNLWINECVCRPTYIIYRPTDGRFMHKHPYIQTYSQTDAEDAMFVREDCTCTQQHTSQRS